MLITCCIYDKHHALQMATPGLCPGGLFGLATPLVCVCVYVYVCVCMCVLYLTIFTWHMIATVQYYTV